VPPKVRDLVSELEKAGFVDRGGKGSHRNYVHPGYDKLVTISGNLGDDAKQYQVKAVRLALKELEQ
jgi:predicted RNA binding protein YcfA (HicA-like mRNA interferase family)